MFVIKRLNFSPANSDDRDWSKKEVSWISKYWDPKKGIHHIVFCSDKKYAKRFHLNAFFILKKLRKQQQDELERSLGEGYIQIHLREGVCRAYALDGSARTLKPRWNISI